jgi:hypothetical protein
VQVAIYVKPFDIKLASAILIFPLHDTQTIALATKVKYPALHVTDKTEVAPLVITHTSALEGHA